MLSLFLSLPLSILLQRLRHILPLPSLLKTLFLSVAPALLLWYLDDNNCRYFITTALILRIAKRPIGVTSNISCGKSTFVSPFKSSPTDSSLTGSTKVIDLDAIAHKILLPPSLHAWKFPYNFINSYGPILSTFGKNGDTNILNNDGTINRTKLGGIIFSDPEKRRKLNKLTHPKIRTIMILEILLSTFLGSVLIIDIPLLFESHLQFMFSSIYVISLEPEEQLKRLKNRNKELKEKECKERIESQMKLTKKISLADHVIDNNGSESDLLNVALKTKKYIIDVERFGMEWVWGFLGLLKSFGYV
ncbi:hypothetical protein TrST_g2910 [Triparma strigata]|uniref:Dephospho-CoA kinase n=1 Tax=Triparma strigata TaxID=1606541 RepID=A0A9W7BNH0_9STRA|nr:hypothetical protein TrST_g2910 [Triparma strigata]